MRHAAIRHAYATPCLMPLLPPYAAMFAVSADATFRCCCRYITPLRFRRQRLRQLFEYAIQCQLNGYARRFHYADISDNALMPLLPCCRCRLRLLPPLRRLFFSRFFIAAALCCLRIDFSLRC